jgi:TolB-like protein/Tfp pilus assembly protein PilF
VFEVAAEVGDPLGWSDGFYRALLVVLGFAFLVTLVLAWYHGERGRQRVGMAEALILGLLIVVGARAAWIVHERGASEPVPGAAEPAEQVGGERDRRTIAVLAFRDRSEAGDQAYLAEGMAEQIHVLLANLPDLRVSALRSAFSFRGTETDVRVIGEQLGVRFVLDGAVVREGDQVRVSSELIDTNDGFEVWSRSFTRELTGVIALQEEIARLVLAEIMPRLSGEGVRVKTTGSPEAHLAYLRGRYHWARQANDSAVVAFREAIAVDSSYADAWASLGTTLTVMATEDPALRELAEEAVGEAMRLDPESADALAARARTALTFDYDWAAAEDALERAVALHPGHVETRHWLSHLLAWTGRTAEGLEEARAAAALDPLSPFMSLNLAVALWWARERSEALAQLEHTLRLAPGFSLAYFYLWDFLLAQGRVAEAGDVLVEWARLRGVPEEAARRVADGITGHLDTGQPAETTSEDLAALGFGASWERRAHRWLGHPEEALEGLWAAHEARTGSYDVLGLKYGDQYPSLRRDPRFQELLRQVGPG